MMPGGAAHDAVGAPNESTLQHGRDVNGSPSVSGESFPPSGVPVSSESCLPDQPSSSGHNVSSGESVPAFSDVVRGAQPDPIEVVPDVDNELPSRPLTVFFNPRARLPANEVFTALQAAKIENKDISCIQRQSSGEIVLTFHNVRTKERFLTNNVVKIRDQPFALQDVDRPLTYVQIFDAPHEMPDATIVQRLAKYCDVIHQRRGYFREEGWKHVQDGVRHYRVRIKRPIPNFIRFGKIQVHFRYEGQPRTCRHCNQTGHYVNACHSIICYNCEELGHLASDCPNEVLCNICKQPNHRAKTCPFSWSRQVSRESTPERENPSEGNREDPPENAREEDPREEVVDVENPEREPSDSSDPPVASGDQEMDESTPTATLELFATPETPRTPPKPQRSRSTTRRPAPVNSTLIPARNRTQPVLVTGKTPEKPAELTNSGTETEMDHEQSEKAVKRKSPEKPRTNKHKKHK